MLRNRPAWLALALVLIAVPARADEPVPAEKARVEGDDPTLWFDARLLDIEGQGWHDTKAPFDRLPAKAEGKVRPPVWGLSRHSAGLCVRFSTDATVLKARWTVTSDRLAMPHMPATGVSGLDLYARADDGTWHWLAVGRPEATTTSATLVSGLPATVRDYLLYLPLYNGVSQIELGLPPGSRLIRPDDRGKPIVFYGTSITQGGCASRPGMVHTAILGRRLDRPVINLGFSGNGTMDASMAELLGELDAAVYVIDCLPNMSAPEVAERTEPLVRALRAARPNTPIVLAEDRSYANGAILAGPRERNAEGRAALGAALARLREAGIKGLFPLSGESQLDGDGEGTVDGSHPTDLGFVQMADAFEPVLRRALGEQPK